MVKGLFFYISFFLIVDFCQAQINTQKAVWVKYGVHHFVPDSLTIDPLSIAIKEIRPAHIISKSDIQLDYSIDAHKVYVNYNKEIGVDIDSFLVTFDVFPINFSDTLSLRSQEDYNAGKYAITYQELDTVLVESPLSEEEVLHTPGIRKHGVITRGLRMGNQQDATFNSTLNLQLDGKLTDDITLEAILSDQEIPFQPEGNTRQLREIDKVYLALRHKNGSLEAGDIGLNNQRQNYFLKYRKQVLGAKLKAFAVDTLSEKKLAVNAGVAMAKGQFVSRQLSVQNGVLGPYKLLGNNNEPFIMVIAGSERIFLNGTQLQRGFENDYIIDYNQSEITFNASIIFDAFSRVRVEYEYVIQDYGRLATNLGLSQKHGNMEVYADWYREADLKNRPITFSASQNAFEALSQAGDSVQSIFVQPQLEEVTEYSANQILYTQKDSIYEGKSHVVFERALAGDGPFYRPSFVFVGLGNGNYIKGDANNNGSEFVWVAPENGKPQGSYTVGNKITAPNLKQMLSVGGKYHLGKNTEVFAEAAFSNQDQNALSDLHDADNQGQAIRIGFTSKKNPLSFSESHTWQTSLSLERLSADFKQVDRFRDIEFQRSWGIFSQQLDTLQDLIGNFSFGIVGKDKSEIHYQLGFRKKEDFLQGFQHQFGSVQKFGRIGLNLQSTLLQIQKNNRNTHWGFLKSDANYSMSWGTHGYTYEINQHNFNLDRQALLSSGLSNYQAHTFYVKSLDSAKLDYKIAYNIRADEQPISQDSTLLRRTNTLSLMANKAKGNSRFKIKFNLRKLETQSDRGNVEENTLSGQATWHQRLFNEAILQDLTFSTGTGRELKRDFIFLNVANGMGTHTWRDYNDNGIQELDEFFEALLPDERNYAKFFVPTNEFLQVYMSNLRHKLSISAPQTWREQHVLEQNNWKHFIAKWSYTNLFNAAYRTSGDDFLERFMPYFTSIPDQDLISGVMALHSTLFFQRYHHQFGFDLHFKKNLRKQLLSGGYESFNSEEWSLNARWLINRDFTQQLSVGKSNTLRASDFMLNQNYQVQSWFIKPSISFQPNVKWKVTAYYQLKKKNALDDALSDAQEKRNVHGSINELSLQLKSNMGKNQQINFSLSSYKISYSGDEQSALGYEMLEGLRNGINHTIRFNLVKRLANGLQLQSTYIGRKSPDRKLIHTGNIQLSALF